MYASKFVACIKHGGKVLREQGENVFVPFGAEYQISLKNLNSVKALVKVWVDGTDATDGTTGLIVEPNQTVDLERFIRAGNMSSGNRFKFIERTEAIENGPRGIKAEDGLIRISVKFAQQPVKIEPYQNSPFRGYQRQIGDSWPTVTPYVPPQPMWTTVTSTTTKYPDFECLKKDIEMGKIGAAGSLGAAAEYLNASASASASSADAFGKVFGEVFAQSCSAQPAPGITVPGSISSQQFVQVSDFPLDGQEHILVFKLVGKVGEKPVEKPVTVKTQPVCTSCGTKNKATSKFCRECGTALTLV